MALTMSAKVITLTSLQGDSTLKAYETPNAFVFKGRDAEKIEKAIGEAAREDEQGTPTIETKKDIDCLLFARLVAAGFKIVII